jgi:ABC-type phosphate transport system substrate-binding protein
MIKKIFILFILLTFIFPIGVLEAQDYSFKIIVNISNPVSSLTKAQVSRIFLKKDSRWEKGEKVYPVDLVGTSLVRENFSKTIHVRGVSAIKAYWQKQIFSGRSVPPLEKMNNNEILDYVKSHPGAIGYVAKTFPTDGIRILNVKD